MTAYDPFAYGEVRLANQGRAPAEPEDMLFADSQPARQDSSAESGWAQLEQEAEGMLQGAATATADAAAFGAEILGEVMAHPEPVPEPEAEAEPAVRRRPVTADRSQLAGRAPANGMPATQRRPEVRGRPREAVTAPTAASNARATNPSSRRAGRRVIGLVMPVLVCGGGGAAAAWFHVSQQNPVMAGILGAATLVAALFSWLLVRG